MVILSQSVYIFTELCLEDLKPPVIVLDPDLEPSSISITVFGEELGGTWQFRYLSCEENFWSTLAIAGSVDSMINHDLASALPFLEFYLPDVPTPFFFRIQTYIH